MLLNPFSFHAPLTLPEAAALFQQYPDNRILAGGTFLLNSLKVLKKKGLKTPGHIISLRKIQELRTLGLAAGTLTIGSLATIQDLAQSNLLTGSLSAIKTCCRTLGANPIRNMATIGGNLTCRYTWTELGTVLLGLDAQLHFSGKDETAETISAEQFFRNEAQTDKILTHITVPAFPNRKSIYQRVNKSSTVDVPLLAICCAADQADGIFRNLRIAVNTTTSFTQRDIALENFLNDKQADPSVIAQAWDHRTASIYATPDEYKAHMFAITLKSALTEFITRSS